MANARCTLLETVYSEKPTVDREGGVIRGVRILGQASKNGREYSEEAMRQAATIYEGLGVNVDHPDRNSPRKERSVTDGIGWLSNVKYIPEQKAVVGDFNILKEHAASGLLFEAAERNPQRFGLSHNAEGRVVSKAGRRIVESIESVKSVDVVQVPATNTGLFESEEPRMKLREFVGKIDKANPQKAALVKLLEEDSMAPMASAEMPADMPDEADSEDQVKAAFRAMVVAAFDDEKLDTKATLTKIKDILKAYEKLNGGGEESPSESKPSDAPSDTSESVKAKRANATELLEAIGIAKPTEAQVSAIAAVSDKKQRAELLESFRPKGTTAVPFGQRPKPAVSAPLLESRDEGNVKYPENAKSFASLLKN